MGSELPDPAWLNRNYRQQAGWKQATTVPATMCTPGWLASNTTLTQNKFWNRSVPTDRQGQQSCLAQSRPTAMSVSQAALCQPFIPGKRSFRSTGSVLPHPPSLPFKEWSVGSAASTHSNSLLIQRLQKKKITGASLLFPPSLSSGLHFSHFFPPEFILTTTRQQS